MKWCIIAFCVFLAAASVASQDEEDELPLAEACDSELCQLPTCRCSSTNIPGGLNARDVPQHSRSATGVRSVFAHVLKKTGKMLNNRKCDVISMAVNYNYYYFVGVGYYAASTRVDLLWQFVVLTFDDGVNVINHNTYRDLLYNRRNSNNCPVGTTFFINHEYTNYEIVNELYNQGFEIALHSVSHQTPQTYWRDATYEDMRREFGEQKLQVSHFANIPYDEIKGVRIPFLQLTGNTSFQVMAEYDLLYDSTWPTINFVNPGLWPYTLDYASTQDCVTLPCPTASIPGVWVFPMVSWQDLEGVGCAMVDGCFYVPPLDDENAWFQFIVQNFERHYLNNRTPFPFYVHEWYLSTYPAVLNALARFLDMINSMNDVFLVNSHEVIDWVRDPIPLDEYKDKPCRYFFPTACPATNCGPLSSIHNIWSQYWMQICNVCPSTYPWVGNPLGQ